MNECEESDSSERAAMRAMLHNAVTKCHCATHPRYADYGGRGIRVCPSWYDERTGRHDVAAFIRWALSHGYEAGKGLRLMRKDPNGNYSPQNCVLGTASETSRHRRSTVMIEIGGVTMCAKDWCAVSGVPYQTFCMRRAGGWDARLAATVPNGVRRSMLARMSPPYDPATSNPHVYVYLSETRKQA